MNIKTAVNGRDTTINEHTKGSGKGITTSVNIVNTGSRTALILGRATDKEGRCASSTDKRLKDTIRTTTTTSSKFVDTTVRKTLYSTAKRQDTPIVLNKPTVDNKVLSSRARGNHSTNKSVSGTPTAFLKSSTVIKSQGKTTITTAVPKIQSAGPTALKSQTTTVRRLGLPTTFTKLTVQRSQDTKFSPRFQKGYNTGSIVPKNQDTIISPRKVNNNSTVLQSQGTKPIISTRKPADTKLQLTESEKIQKPEDTKIANLQHTKIQSSSDTAIPNSQRTIVSNSKDTTIQSFQSTKISNQSGTVSQDQHIKIPSSTDLPAQNTPPKAIGTSPSTAFGKPSLTAIATPPSTAIGNSPSTTRSNPQPTTINNLQPSTIKKPFFNIGRSQDTSSKAYIDITKKPPNIPPQDTNIEGKRSASFPDVSNMLKRQRSDLERKLRNLHFVHCVEKVELIDQYDPNCWVCQKESNLVQDLKSTLDEHRKLGILDDELELLNTGYKKWILSLESGHDKCSTKAVTISNAIKKALSNKSTDSLTGKLEKEEKEALIGKI